MSILLNAMERTERGRKTRKMGYIPGIIYGPGVERNIYIQVKENEMNSFLNKHSTSISTRVKVKEKELTCVIKDIQYEPISKRPIHIDLYASSHDKPVKIKLPFNFKGRQQFSRGDLVLNILNDEIEVEGLLKDLPEIIDIDVSQLEAGSVITVADIDLPEGVKPLLPEDEVIVSVSEHVQIEEVDEAAEKEEVAEADQPAESDGSAE
ncbi:MAG TPA: 50S ribosomal protein L25 [Clostridiales bacterium]|nr:50S ribosomal protein L25 [Clostridiales bacterium]